MNFKLTEEQEAILKAVREFAKKELTREITQEYELAEKYPSDLVKKSCELGFGNIEFPEKYGGQGYTFFEKVLVTIELCRASSTLGIVLAEPCGLGADLIEKFGNEEQIEKYLIPVLKSEGPSAGAFTEPAHGTDITFLDTKAVLNGDKWVINGAKTFISRADVAQSLVVLCQTDTKVKPTYRGQTMFIVEKGTSRLEVTPLRNKLGNKCSALCDVVFDSVEVPEENLLGELNRGFYQVFHLFNRIRILGGARTLGMAEGAYDIALNYAKERKVFGQTISEYQGNRWKLAEMRTKLEMVRLLVYKAGWLEGQNMGDPVLSAMCKIAVPFSMLEVINAAIQLLGGYGYMSEYDLERRWRDARAFAIAGGSVEMSKNTVARFLIDKGHLIP